MQIFYSTVHHKYVFHKGPGPCQQTARRVKGRTLPVINMAVVTTHQVDRKEMDMMSGRHMREYALHLCLHATLEGRGRHVYHSVYTALHHLHKRIMPAGIGGLPE